MLLSPLSSLDLSLRLLLRYWSALLPLKGPYSYVHRMPEHSNDSKSAQHSPNWELETMWAYSHAILQVIPCHRAASQRHVQKARVWSGRTGMIFEQASISAAATARQQGEVRAVITHRLLHACICIGGHLKLEIRGIRLLARWEQEGYNARLDQVTAAATLEYGQFQAILITARQRVMHAFYSPIIQRWQLYVAFPRCGKL